MRRIGILPHEETNMRRSASIGIGGAIAAVVTYWMVSSGRYFNGDQWFPLAIERLWSYAHGWAPLSHIREFGAFYKPLVHLLCPLLGFALYRMTSRREGSVWIE